MTTLAVYREPFSLGAPRFARLPDGLSLLGLRRSMPGLPEGFDDHGVICVNGVEAPRALWGAIKPKASVTEVTFHMPPRGGEDGAKNILSIVASIGDGLYRWRRSGNARRLVCGTVCVGFGLGGRCIAWGIAAYVCPCGASDC